MVLAFLGFPLTLAIGLVLLALAGKSEPDALRERPAALYLSIMMLIGVVLLFAATFLTANGLVQLTNTSPNDFSRNNTTLRVGPRGALLQPYGYRGTVNHDDDVSQVVGGLILGAIALGLLGFHLPKLEQATADSEGPGSRVFVRAVYFVAGTALLTGLGAAGAAVYAVYGMIAPDTAGAGAVTDALRSFISALALAAVAAYVFLRAWRRAEELRVVPPVVVPDAPPAPAPRARATKKAAPPTE